MRRLFVLATAAIVALIALAVAVWLASLQSPHAGWEGDEVTVVLPSGEPAAASLRRLREAGVLARTWPLRGWLAVRGGADRIRAGEYRFDREATPIEVLDRLQSGDVALHALTVPEGLTLRGIARLAETAGFGEEAALREAFEDPAPIADLDAKATDLEGYLFPDTYRFPRGVEPRTIARTMVRRFRDVADDDYVERARAAGLGLREAVILASMIERESGLSAERPRISRVFHNRLRRGMLLQCDPTVLYAWERRGEPVARLTSKHLLVDSPWNTYANAGLPVGPIGNPGAESLEAAVAPDEGDDLYFVARPGGGHTFSKSYEDHRRAVGVWRNYVRSSSSR